MCTQGLFAGACDLPAASLTGLRPATFDGTPIVGAAPGFDNLMLNTGHGTLGWTMSAGSGQLMADPGRWAASPVSPPKAWGRALVGAAPVPAPARPATRNRSTPDTARLQAQNSRRGHRARRKLICAAAQSLLFHS